MPDNEVQFIHEINGILNRQLIYFITKSFNSTLIYSFTNTLFYLLMNQNVFLQIIKIINLSIYSLIKSKET